MQVALAHDFLAARAGGERVLIALANAFPDAPIHTLIHDPASGFNTLDTERVQTSHLDRLYIPGSQYRRLLPLAVPAFRAMRSDAAVTICSTSGLSHHIRTSGIKIVYCHTPARWLHAPDTYLEGFGIAVRAAARLAALPLRSLDVRAMRAANYVVANSTHVAGEISQIYGRNAEVIHPCSSLDIDQPGAAIDGVEPGFVLSPARPLGYKRLDLLVAAARLLPDHRFLHVGAGPHHAAFAASCPPNVLSVGAVSDAQLRWAYQNARLVGLTAAEDFGLVPREAAAHGVHTVAPAARGILDHDDTMMTTYAFGSAQALAAAIESAPPPTGVVDPSHLGVEAFTDAVQDLVARAAR